MAADLKENEMTLKSDCEWVRALDANGNSIRISKQDLASVVGGLLSKSNKIVKTSKRGVPCVFDGLGEGFYYMTISNESLRRYFALQNQEFTEPFGDAWFSKYFNLSLSENRSITVNQSIYDTINIMICRVG